MTQILLTNMDFILLIICENQTNLCAFGTAPIISGYIYDMQYLLADYSFQLFCKSRAFNPFRQCSSIFSSDMPLVSGIQK